MSVQDFGPMLAIQKWLPSMVSCLYWLPFLLKWAISTNFLYTIAVVIVLLTSVQLILYLYYQNHSIIKASSPYLSLFMFAGCYLLCIAAILSTTTFYSKMSLRDFGPMLAIQKTIAFNGLMLVLIALFIKMLRVYCIFSSKLQRDIGCCWGRLPLLIIILTLMILSNIVLKIINATLKHTFQQTMLPLIQGLGSIQKCILMWQQ